MSFRAFVLLIAGFCGCAALQAQIPALPPCLGLGGPGDAGCTVGSSFDYDFGQLFGLEALVAEIDSAGDGILFTYSVSATGTLPPGLTLSPSGLLSGTFTASGDFSFTLTISLKLTYQGAVVFDLPFSIPFDLMVADYSGDQVTVDPIALNFNLTQGGSAATQSVSVTNHGGQAVSVLGLGGNKLGRQLVERHLRLHVPFLLTAPRPFQSSPIRGTCSRERIRETSRFRLDRKPSGFPSTRS